MALASVIVAPGQTGALPVMAITGAFTVTIAVLAQPPGKAYVIIAVPITFPVTIPDVSTAAMLASLEDQVPPIEASISVVVEPTQAVRLPVTGSIGLMVIVAVV